MSFFKEQLASPEAIQAAVAQAQAESVVKAPPLPPQSPSILNDIEIPESDFFTNPAAQVADEDIGDESDVVAEDVSAPAAPQAPKRYRGEKAKMARELEALRAALAEKQQYEEFYEKVNQLAHDPEKLIETVTGVQFNEWVKPMLTKAEIFQRGTEHQKELLRLQERTEALEREQLAKQYAAQRAAERQERQQIESQKARVYDILDQEMENWGFSTADEVRDTKIRRSVVSNTLRDLESELAERKKLSPARIRELFKENASLYEAANNAAVERNVGKVLEKKKEVARQRAAEDAFDKTPRAAASKKPAGAEERLSWLPTDMVKNWAKYKPYLKKG